MSETGPDSAVGVGVVAAAETPAAEIPAAEDGPPRGSGYGEKFHIRLENFEGPFDLLLQLISKHKLDVTEVALSQVTDDFIAHIRSMGDDWDLGQVSEFLLIAATLLDLKAARLLPAAEVEDEEDLALLEARDLLFARLLQYRAFKQVASFLAERERDGATRWPRAVQLEARFAAAMPEVLLGLGPEQFARLAVKAMTPKPVPTVSIDHIHAPKVSVREHAAILRERLARLGQASFRALCTDCANTLEIVARFLALLELYREGVLLFDQIEPLGELHVRWVGGSDRVVVEIDEYGSDADTPPAPSAVGAVPSDAADAEPTGPEPVGPPPAVPASRSAPSIETKERG
ncbi:segregation and condensation protein A [Cryptosporangium minutisporangium]|uniref:Segregation and condensation protein A n=1 Tax=Cryptosporangium minutisporangium TaxID=113569 RepID=A0ABP6SZZ4_9ACTN